MHWKSITKLFFANIVISKDLIFNKNTNVRFIKLFYILGYLTLISNIWKLILFKEVFMIDKTTWKQRNFRRHSTETRNWIEASFQTRKKWQQILFFVLDVWESIKNLAFLHCITIWVFVLHLHLLNVPNTKTGNEKLLKFIYWKTMRIKTWIHYIKCSRKNFVVSKMNKNLEMYYNILRRFISCNYYNSFCNHSLK